ncbi:M67 family metallopeptidase [Paenibacillus puldeungensis]|uniref:M67 family metallopeptidase n=1 Tax=Paenibacillus puldeungensis TaxID=696536 RepID=A0ABW3RWA1_9BACL
MKLTNENVAFSSVIGCMSNPALHTALWEDSLRRSPEEACGLLFGMVEKNKIILERYLPVMNTAADPRRAFELTPKAWVSSCFNPKLIGIYHSHPTAPPEPSSEDLHQLPLFAKEIAIYLIGSLTQAKKPPGEQGDFLINAYAVTLSANSDYMLRKIPFI